VIGQLTAEEVSLDGFLVQPLAEVEIVNLEILNITDPFPGGRRSASFLNWLHFHLERTSHIFR
jgi:hypothetical protein